MQLYWDNQQHNRPRSIALGTFDGVHLGHQELLRHAIINKPTNGISSVLTFDVPPEQYFRNEFSMLCSFPQKVALMRDFGFDEVIWAKFDQNVAKIEPHRFVEDILVSRLQSTHIVCGYDYSFGYKGAGNASLLQELGEKYGFTVTVVPPVAKGQTPISSTLIRTAITNGEVELAATMLGRYPVYQGEVVAGAGRGRQLGFPTANLKIDPLVLLPSEGVYVTWCILEDGQGYPSVTSVGKNPTFEGQTQTIEAYILNYEGNLYNRPIEIQFLHYLRDIYRYKSVEELTGQIEQDVQELQRVITRFHLQDNRVVLK